LRAAPVYVQLHGQKARDMVQIGINDAYEMTVCKVCGNKGFGSLMSVDGSEMMCSSCMEDHLRLLRTEVELEYLGVSQSYTSHESIHIKTPNTS
jgi:hypothetical protein